MIMNKEIGLLVGSIFLAGVMCSTYIAFRSAKICTYAHSARGSGDAHYTFYT